MAHVRKNCKNVSTTISFEPEVLEALDDYWYENRKGNRSVGANELIMLGLRYKKIVEKKKRERMLAL